MTPESITLFFDSHPYLLIIILLWSLFWKGLALWKSAQLKQPIWFVALLVINTVGILEILYLFGFSKVTLDKPKKIKKKRRK